MIHFEFKSSDKEKERLQIAIKHLSYNYLGNHTYGSCWYKKYTQKWQEFLHFYTLRKNWEEKQIK